MPVQNNLLQIRRGLYNRFQANSRRSLGNLSSSLRRYFLQYQREFTHYKAFSSHAELIQAFLKSDILICGDYHTLPQAQRTVLRLLKGAVGELRRQGRHPVLALEMLRNADTKAARKYLTGRLTERRFLQAIRYRKHWGFAWENYRPLFQFLRENQVEVIGLNQTERGRKPAIRSRDRFAARVLARTMQKDPKATILALVGDLHLAQPHLPAALEREWARKGTKAKMVVVHQNPERLYWKLAAKKLEHKVGVIQLKRNVYCVMNTPPWVKLRSYVRWVEGGSEAEEFLDLVRTIQHSLALGPLVHEDFTIVHPAEKNRIRINADPPFLKRLRPHLVAALGSYFEPGGKHVFLAGSNANGAATQAAVYLHASLSKRSSEYVFPKKDFYLAVWVEALGFLGSKVINPHRRCHQPRDFQAAARSSRLASLVAQHLEAEYVLEKNGRFRGISLPLRVGSLDRAVFYYRTARCLGQMLGNGLYEAVVTNQVSSKGIRKLFRNPFTHGKRARDQYLQWVLWLDARKLR